MKTVNFENTELSIHETNDAKQWYMTTEEVATAYSIDRTVVVKHLKNHENELRENIEKGVHSIHTPGGVQQKTVIYRDGVIKLGFFIRSPKAVAFRQFATDLIVDHAKKYKANTPEHFVDMLVTLEDRMNDGFTEVKDVCRGLRDEVDELREAFQIFVSDSDQKEIRELIKEVKAKLGLDGRAIVGQIRKSLNLATIYDSPSARRVKNILKNMLGRGLIIIKEKEAIAQA